MPAPGRINESDRDMLKKLFKTFALFVAGAAFFGAAMAQTEADGLITSVSTEVIDTVKSDQAIQGGDTKKLSELIDTKVMPHVDFQSMTQTAVGVRYRSATPEQRSKLQQEFKGLLLRSYAGAIAQVKDEKVQIRKSFALKGEGAGVEVQSDIKGRGEPIALNYRLNKVDGAWKIIDVNVGGVWLVGFYNQQFAPTLSSGGIDGLIAKLGEMNAKPASKS
jgi:phospholipid transport system substrate-binding protein